VVESVVSLNNRLAGEGQIQTSRVFQVLIAALLVYEAAIATLAGVHIGPPRSLTCPLRERWEQMFRNKDEDSIRRIQDAFSCCGFNSPRDMAFPFPDNNNAQGSEACMIRYDRNTACVDSWREQERKVAIMLLVVPIAVFLWKVVILLSPSSSSFWLPTSIRLPDDSQPNSPRSHRKRPQAITYRDIENADEDDSIQDEVQRLNNDSTLASRVEGERARSNGPYRDHDHWREHFEET
jgi:hypothetical protein